MKADNVFVSFLELLKVKHTKSFSNKYFGEHPNKYNLFGLFSMLTDYGIEATGIKIEDKDICNLSEIETPFIAHLGNDFVTVSKITPNKVSYMWNGLNVVINSDKFKEAWSGIVLLAEANDKSIEPEYKKNKRMLLFNDMKKYAFFLSIFFPCFYAFYANHVYNNAGIIILLLVNLIGLYVCMLLLLKQIHIQSTYADKICSLFKQNDCNNILESKAAKMGGFIGWSELGFGYFIANTLIILFFQHLLSYLTIINLIVLPYSFWSVWYQKVKVKQWCPLCIIVQVVFWSLFVIHFLFNFIQIPNFKIEDIVLCGIMYVIFPIGINLLLPKFSEPKKLEQITQEINSIKATDEVFLALLMQQPYYEVNKTDSKIIFGNPNAKIAITILTNPHCEPCANMHIRVVQLMETIAENCYVQYIFSSFREDLERSNQFLISVYLTKNIQTVINIYDEWFKYGKYRKDDFIKQFDVDLNKEEVREQLLSHNQWLNATQLRATPTILINGYELPRNYKIEDIKYFTHLDIDKKRI